MEPDNGRTLEQEAAFVKANRIPADRPAAAEPGAPKSFMDGGQEFDYAAVEITGSDRNPVPGAPGQGAPAGQSAPASAEPAPGVIGAPAPAASPAAPAGQAPSPAPATDPNDPADARQADERNRSTFKDRFRQVYAKAKAKEQENEALLSEIATLKARLSGTQAGEDGRPAPSPAASSPQPGGPPPKPEAADFIDAETGEVDQVSLYAATMDWRDAVQAHKRGQEEARTAAVNHEADQVLAATERETAFQAQEREWQAAHADYPQAAQNLAAISYRPDGRPVNPAVHEAIVRLGPAAVQVLGADVERAKKILNAPDPLDGLLELTRLVNAAPGPRPGPTPPAPTPGPTPGWTRFLPPGAVATPAVPAPVPPSSAPAPIPTLGNGGINTPAASFANFNAADATQVDDYMRSRGFL